MSTRTYIDEPVQYDLPKIVSGEDWQFQFLLQNPDGSAVNTAGMSFACQMRDKTDAVIFTPSVSVSTNTVTLALANSVTVAVKQGVRLSYDIVQTDSLGKKLVLFQGAIQFEKAITR